MVQELFDKYIFLYIMAGLCGFGIFMKLVINIVYKCLMKASDNMANSRNKLMKLVKLKFEACYKLKIGVNNVDTFVDKYVYKHKFCGIYLYTWENLGGQLLMLCLLTGTIGAGLGLVYDCGRVDILSTFFVGIVASALQIIVESFINLSAKRNVIKINMKDYLENLLKVRMEQEYFRPEQLQEYRNEYFEPENIEETVSEKEVRAKDMDNEDIRELAESLAVSREDQLEERIIKKAALHNRGKRAVEIPEQRRNEKVKKKNEAKVYAMKSKEEDIIEDILKEFMA